MDTGLCDLKENEAEQPEDIQDSDQEDLQEVQYLTASNVALGIFQMLDFLSPLQTILPASSDDLLILSAEPILLQPNPQDNFDELENIDLDRRMIQNEWIDHRGEEEPIELQGLSPEPDLPRTKYYYDNDNDDIPVQQEPRIDYFDYDYTDGQDEETKFNDEEDRQESLFYRKNRMDVKKPGPFVEASPNNFYLDKMSYDRYDDTDDIITNDTSKESGQEEYEIPMPQPAPSKEKRIVVNPQDPAEEVLGKTENNNNLNDYVHIALNNK